MTNHPLLALAEAEEQERYQELEDLEAYRKGMADAPILYRATGYTKDSDPDLPLMDFVASEESEDRYGDVIEVAGWQLGEFRANPVLLFAHDNRTPAVGKVHRIGTEGQQLLASVTWDMDDPFAAKLQNKYAKGFMRAVSVGFRPLEWVEQKDGGFRFTKQDLLELSAVPVPAHPRALKKAFYVDNPDAGPEEILQLKSRLEIVERAVKELRVMPPPEPEPEPVEKQDNQEPVIPEDLAKQLEDLFAAIASKES